MVLPGRGSAGPVQKGVQMEFLRWWQYSVPVSVLWLHGRVYLVKIH